MTYKVTCTKCGKELGYSTLAITGEPEHSLVFSPCNCKDKEDEPERPPLGSWWRSKKVDDDGHQNIHHIDMHHKDSMGINAGSYWDYDKLDEFYKWNERFFPCTLCGKDMIIKETSTDEDSFLWCDNCCYESNTFVESKIVKGEGI